MLSSKWKWLLSLLLVASGAIQGSHYMAFAQSSSNFKIHLDHRLALNEFGFLFVSDTVTFTNIGSIPVPLPDFSINYPPNYINFTVATKVSAPAEDSLELSSNAIATRARIIPKEQYVVNPNRSAEVRLQLLLEDNTVNLDSTNYRFTVSIAPTLSIFLDSLNSTIILPRGVEFFGPLEGFEKDSGALLSIYAASFDEPEKILFRFMDMIVQVSDSREFSIVKFNNFHRELIVMETGEIKVQETINLTNRGFGTLVSLPISLLNSKISEITVVPNTAPPLRATQRIKYHGAISLLTDLNLQLNFNQSLLLSYVYGLSSESYNLKDGKILLTVPFTPPIDGMVSKAETIITIPSGFHLSSGEVRRVLANASSLSSERFEAAVTPGVAWASGQAAPISTFVFLISVAILVGSARTLRKSTEISTQGRPVYSIIFREKIDELHGVLSDLRNKKADNLTRRMVEEAKQKINQSSNNATSKLSPLRQMLPSLKSDIQRSVNEAFSLDKEYDKAVGDFVGVCDQVVARRINKESFERQRQNHLKRIKRVSDDLKGTIKEF